MPKLNLDSLFPESLVEKIEDACLGDLESFFRDAYMSAKIFQKYKKGQILQETGFMDVTELEGGMAAHVRYHIFSGMTETYRPSFVEYRSWTLPQGCFFKVLDVQTQGSHGVISLLQIPEFAVPYFALNVHPKEAELAKSALARFQKAMMEPPVPQKKDPYWLKRTHFPIGIDSDDIFFFQFDYSAFPKRDPNYKRKNILARIFR